MADEGDPGAGRMNLQCGNDAVDARASKCRLDRGRDVREGTRGDLSGRPGAGKRARQQQVWPTVTLASPRAATWNLGLTVGSERTLIVENARRSSGYRGGVANQQELH